MLDIARLSLSQAQDTLWLLQTDPSYLQMIVRNILEGGLPSAVGKARVWKYLGGFLPGAAVNRAMHWQAVVEEIEHVQKV